MGQAGSLLWRLDLGVDERKLDLFVDSGDRDRRYEGPERLAGDLDRDDPLRRGLVS